VGARGQVAISPSADSGPIDLGRAEKEKEKKKKKKGS